MLDNLLEIEIAYNMLKVDDDTAKDPIDMHYEKLKTDIQVLLSFLHLSDSVVITCLFNAFDSVSILIPVV